MGQYTFLSCTKGSSQKNACSSGNHVKYVCQSKDRLAHAQYVTAVTVLGLRYSIRAPGSLDKPLQPGCTQ